MGRGVVGLLVLVVSLAVGSPVAAGSLDKSRHKKRHEPKYDLAFEVKKGSYGSTIAGGGYSISESDNFTAAANYDEIEIPPQGSVSISHVSDLASFEGSDGDGPEWEKTDSSGLDCTGSLVLDPAEQPQMTGDSSNGELSLQVELARRVDVVDAKGHTGTNIPCDKNPFYPNGSLAFYPASIKHPSGPYTAKMLTAKLNISLKDLRNMTPGGAPMDIKVNSTDNILERPPADCAADGSESCTQHVGWKGVIEITRAS